MPSDTDWAYAAGFVDGEGCIAIVRSSVQGRARFYYAVQIMVANRERAILDWMEATWGGGVVSVAARSGRSRPTWYWRGGNRPNARRFLVGIKPWLRLKVPQCENALAMIDLLQRGHQALGRAPLPQAWLEEQERLYWIQRQLNHRGSEPFVAKPMHSPRKIHRARALAAAQAATEPPTAS